MAKTKTNSTMKLSTSYTRYGVAYKTVTKEDKTPMLQVIGETRQQDMTILTPTEDQLEYTKELLYDVADFKDFRTIRQATLVVTQLEDIIGIATKIKSKDNQPMILVITKQLENYIINIPKSIKQLEYIQDTMIKQLDQTKSNRERAIKINKATMTVSKIKSTYEPIAEHPNEKQTTKEPTTREKLIQQEDTQKAANAKTHKRISKELAKEEQEEASE